jgi:sodium transport system permease protein
MLQGYLLVLGQRERTSVATAIAGAQDPAEQQRLRKSLSEPAPGAPPGPVDVRFGAEDPDPPSAGGPSELRFDGSKSRSALARDRVKERLQALAADARIDALDGDAGALEAFRVERVSLASQREESAYMLSFILPMMFCIMTVLGAFFPAIDTTAGEKERRTAETTLLLPVPRSAVLLGKLLAVSACAVAATALNVAGLLAAAEHLIAGLGDGSIEVSVPWSAFPAAAPLLLLFIVTTSALMLSIGCGADTFKQGQSLLAPVQMVILLPAMIVSMPGIDLSPTLALVPVAQTALAFKAILQGDARALDLVLVAVSQVLYAGLALALALRRGSSEALLLAGSGKKRKLGALLRRGRRA